MEGKHEGGKIYRDTMRDNRGKELKGNGIRGKKDKNLIASCTIQKVKLPNVEKLQPLQANEIIDMNTENVMVRAPLCRGNYLVVKAGERLIDALIDTGACSSFLSHSLYKMMNNRSPLCETEKIVHSASGHSVKILGKCCAIIEVDSVPIRTDFLVSDSIAFDIILGDAFLTKNAAVLKCEDKTIELKCPVGILASMRCEILPKSTIAIEAYLEGDIGVTRG